MLEEVFVIKRFRKIFCMLICAVLFFSATFPVFGADQRKVVKVAYFLMDGYHYIDENGARRGYGYEYLQEMAKYCDWKYEYVECSWGEALEMLEDGRVDLVTSAQKNPEREAKFDYSSYGMGYSDTIVTVSSSNMKYDRIHYGTLDGIHVGMLSGNSRNKSFEDFCNEKEITYKVSYYDDSGDLENALKDGQVEAIVTSNLRVLSEERIVAEFNPSPYYAIVKKGNDALLQEVDYALEKIGIESPAFQIQLYNKYYRSGNGGAGIVYTDKEKLYLQNNKKFKAEILTNRPPLAYMENDEIKGIIPDIITLASKQVGLEPVFVSASSDNMYNKRSRSEILNGIDVRAFVYADLYSAEESNMRLTSPYMHTSFSLLSLDNSNGGNMKIAVPDFSIFERNYAEKNYGAENIVYCPGYEECVEAVRSGEAASAIINSYVAENILYNDVKRSFIATLISEEQVDVAIGVYNDANPQLFSLLNKCVNNLSTDQVNQIVTAHTIGKAREVTLGDFLYKNPVMMLGFVVLISVCIIALLVIFFQKKAKKQELSKKRELMDALDTARQASTAKGDFMSRMSHEIRTPLNAMIGFMAIAKQNLDNQDKVKDCINKGEFAARHLLSLINDVLDMSAIENGKMRLVHENFSFQLFVSSITGMFYGQAKAKDIKFEVALAGVTEEYLRGDQLRLNQILINLLNNAVKFTPKGGSVTLKITQTLVKDGRVHFSFQVSDTGVGMSSEFIKKIGTPFEQQDGGVYQKFGGSGLGLSITKNLLSLMGGVLRVESKEGQGSVFTAVVSFEIDSSNRICNGELPLSFKKVHALVVDDEISNCEYHSMLLRNCGATCEYALSGKQALEMIKATLENDDLPKYDLCLVDWRMPVMNGIEFIGEIRKLVNDEIHIIVATAYDYSEVESLAKENNVEFFINKPIFQSTMLDSLLTVYGKYRPGDVKPAEIPDFEGKRVLLAEDNELNMEIAIEILSTAGLQVEPAENGKIALDMFEASEENYYDLIILDVQMPVMDGYETARKIRKSEHPRAIDIPIIAMTANAFAEDVSESIAAGMNNHIAKPVDLGQLFEVLKKNI